jgi:hypothetical protein
MGIRGGGLRNRYLLKLILFLLNLDKPGSLNWQQGHRFPTKVTVFTLNLGRMALS